MPKKSGRPTKLTKELQAEIVKYLKVGNYVEVAASIVGIHKDSLYEWLKRGAREKARRKKGEKPNYAESKYVSFSDAVKSAQGKAEAINLGFIHAAARKGQWQAAAWHLERMFPAKWGRRDNLKLEIKGEIEKFVETLEDNLDEATMQKVLDAIAHSRSSDTTPDD